MHNPLGSDRSGVVPVFDIGDMGGFPRSYLGNGGPLTTFTEDRKSISNVTIR